MRTKKEVLYTCLTNQIVSDNEISDITLYEAIWNSIEFSNDDDNVVQEVLAAMQEYATEWSKAGEEGNELDSYIENLEQEWK